MKSSKILCLVLALCLCLASTVALAGDAEQITLKFWDMTWGGTEYPAEAAKLAESYSEVAPNVKIEYQSIPWQNRYETFSVAVASGEAPDVSTGGGYQQHQFAAAGEILPVNSIIEEWAAEGKLDDFPAGMVEFFQDDEGNQLGVPFNIDPRGIIYRTDLFEEAGLAIPTNWEELKACAIALTDADNGKYGLVFPASDSSANVIFFTWLVSNGGGVWNEDGTEPDWVKPQNIETLDYITELRDAGVFPEGMAGYTNADAQKLFLQGDAAMIIDSVGFGTQIAAVSDDFAANVALMSMPVGPSASEPMLATAMNAYMVYSQTKHPEEAKAFIKWWSENNLEIWTGPAACGSPPARLSFLNDTSFTDNPANPFVSQMVETWIPEMQNTMYPAKAANLAQNTFDAERWWRDLAQAALIGEKTSQQILEEKQQAANDLMMDLGL